MSLADELKTLPRERSASGCKIGDVLGGLDGSDFDALIDVLADKRIAHVHIVAALNRNGYDVNEKAVGWHRNGKCKCHR